jgi:energy-coupling factor transporter transmembrane protein EcfT
MRLNRLEIKNDRLKKFDPRARVMAGISLILLGVNVSNLGVLSGMIALCFLLLRRDGLCVVKRLIPLESFCALFVLQAAFGLLSWNTAGVFVLRVNCAALLSMLMIIPLCPGVLAGTLRVFRLNHKLICIFYLSYRYIFLMYDKVFFSIEAMKLRAPASQKGTLYRWKVFAALFASSLAAGFVKAEEVTTALQARGFDGVIPQTSLWVWGVRDTVLVFASCLGLGLYGTYKVFGRLFFL